MARPYCHNKFNTDITMHGIWATVKLCIINKVGVGRKYFLSSIIDHNDGCDCRK